MPTNENGVLSETDARNYAFATNTTNWGRRVREKSTEIANVLASEIIVSRSGLVVFRYKNLVDSSDYR